MRGFFGDLSKYLLEPASLALAGLLGAGIVAFARHRLHRSWFPPLFTAVSAFFAGTSLPYGVVLLLYPFAKPPPDLTVVSYYVPVAGLALVWAGVYGLRQAVKVHSDDDASTTAPSRPP